MLASLQGRLVALLESVLRQGGTTKVTVANRVTPTLYKGANADLLQLQEDVIQLALEVLGSDPPAAPAAK